jgi:hypothetical protein
MIKSRWKDHHMRTCTSGVVNVVFRSRHDSALETWLREENVAHIKGYRMHYERISTRLLSCCTEAHMICWMYRVLGTFWAIFRVILLCQISIKVPQILCQNVRQITHFHPIYNSFWLGEKKSKGPNQLLPRQTRIPKNAHKRPKSQILGV